MIKHLRRLLKPFQYLDFPLLTALALLVGISFVLIYSAGGANSDDLVLQFRNSAIAMFALWGANLLQPKQWAGLTLPGYMLLLVVLMAVDAIGMTSHGAQRWLDLGFIKIQPSELCKIIVPATLAWYFDSRQSSLRTLDFGIAFCLLLFPCALIVIQPDLGTAVLVAASGFFVIFFAGLPIRAILAIGAFALSMVPFTWYFLHDYQKQRVLILLDPTRDPLGAGYHTIQATIAIGSGGLWGKGWLEGTQARLDFLPEAKTDFIFAVLGEEFGFVGIMAILALVTFIIARGFMLCLRAKTRFERLLGAALVGNFFLSATINMAMVIGIFPVVGIPFPVLSYGGSSLVTTLLTFGIVMRIGIKKPFLYL